MRFISHSGNFKIQVVGEKVTFTQYGDRIVDREGFIAEFNQNDLNEGDIEFAEKTWPNLPGRSTEMDEVTPSPLVYRLSVYDTDEEALRGSWEGRTLADHRGVFDMKEYVEAVLSKRADAHPDFRMIEVIPLTAPWPNYLEYQGTPDQLISKVEMDGHDLREVLRYEMQLDERPQVIEAIRQRLDEQIMEAQGAEVVPA